MKVSNNDVLCHIVGLNPVTKDNFINKFAANDRIEMIDLDEISSKILNSRKIKEIYSEYDKVKYKKTKKTKDLEKEMTALWVETMKNRLETEVNRYKQKEIIVIGNNHHPKYTGKKIKIPTENFYILKSNVCKDVECLIEYNLENYRNQIVKGTFPIKYLNFNFLKEKKRNLNETYKKKNYEEISMTEFTKSINIYLNKVINF